MRFSRRRQVAGPCLETASVTTDLRELWTEHMTQNVLQWLALTLTATVLRN
jgi:hypothetical protein